MQRNPDSHTMLRVISVRDETPTVRTLEFADEPFSAALPGEFAMVWVPGAGELPMSIMLSEEEGRAAFTVRRHGSASTALYNTAAGEHIGVRGPYGNSFEIRDGRLLLVGGGTGLVPLMRLLKHTGDSHDVTFLMGARTASEVFFTDFARRILGTRKGRIITVTEDGTDGEKGLVTDAAARLFSTESFDAVYTCGPELMMHGIVETACSHDLFVQASIERVMKCGVGICGSCCMGESIVCRDGTVFEGVSLAANTEFGRYYRTKSGLISAY